MPDLLLSPRATSSTLPGEAVQLPPFPTHAAQTLIPPPRPRLPLHPGRRSLQPSLSNCPLQMHRLSCPFNPSLPPNMSPPLQLPSGLPVLDTGAPCPTILQPLPRWSTFPHPRAHRATTALVRPTIPLAYHAGSQPSITAAAVAHLCLSSLSSPQFDPRPLLSVSFSCNSSNASANVGNPCCCMHALLSPVGIMPHLRDLPSQDGLTGMR